MKGQTARAIVFNPKGELLVIERRKNGEHFFVLPGGHIEKGESPEKAVIREVLEELGVQLAGPRLLYSDIDGLGNHQEIYLCDYVSGEPKLQEGSVEFKQADQLYSPRWVIPEQLQNTTFYPTWLFHEFMADKRANFSANPRSIEH